MKYSTGILDALFGKKTTIVVRRDDGTLRRLHVSVAWLTRMKEAGREIPIPANAVHLHIVGPRGLEHGQLVVGKDIPEDHYKKLVDPTTGALYALKVYEDGVPSTTVISKAMWDKARRAMDLV